MKLPILFVSGWCSSSRREMHRAAAGRADVRRCRAAARQGAPQLLLSHGTEDEADDHRGDAEAGGDGRGAAHEQLGAGHQAHEPDHQRHDRHHRHGSEDCHLHG